MNVLSPTDLIYISPDINGCSPDFVIARPNVGIMVISVFEENIAECEINKDSNLIEVYSNNQKRSIQNPYYSLENYQNLTIENTKEFTEAIIDNNRNLSLAKRVLICTTGKREDAIKLWGEWKHVSIYGNEFISDENIARRFFSDERFFFPNHIFDDVATSKIEGIFISRLAFLSRRYRIESFDRSKKILSEAWKAHSKKLVVWPGLEKLRSWRLVQSMPKQELVMKFYC